MPVPYDAEFFSEIANTATQSAEVIAPLVTQLVAPNSVVDIGGGEGCWAAAFAQAGASHSVCVDGSYVDRATLRVPQDSFVEADLTAPLRLGRRFDLAVCLEVGEHLPEGSADTLIESLVHHADAVLFSAAIPHQSGTCHVNTQWPAYWAAKFRAHGFRCFDCIRVAVWDQPAVAGWYKQNTLLYLNAAAITRLSIASTVTQTEVISPRPMVHPDIYLTTVRELKREPQLGQAVRTLAYSAKRSIQARAGRAFGAI